MQPLLNSNRGRRVCSLDAKRMMNPYEPPKTDSKTEYDRWLESVKKQDETDWGCFIFIVVWLFIFFFHQVLFKFFVDIFRSL